MSIQIISVVVDGQQVDSKVQGSHLSVGQYGASVALVIRNLASLFAKNSGIPESDVLDELLRVVNSQARNQEVKTETFLLQ